MVEFKVIFKFIFEYLNIFLVYSNDNNETNTFQNNAFLMLLNSLHRKTNITNYVISFHFFLFPHDHIKHLKLVLNCFKETF